MMSTWSRVNVSSGEHPCSAAGLRIEGRGRVGVRGAGKQRGSRCSTTSAYQHDHPY